MVSTRQKRQSNKQFLSQLDDFDQGMIIGNAVSERQQNAVVNEGTNDRDFTVSTSNNDSVVNGSAMSAKALKRCFIEMIDREMSNIVDTVEDRIQKAILTAIENIVAPKNELAIRSINASSERDAASVSANSDHRERVGINASFENASKNNDTLDASNVNDETRHDNPDEVSELSVPETHFDRQAHTHHRYDQDSKNYVNQFTVIENIQICDFVWEISHLLTFHISYFMIAREDSPFSQSINQTSGAEIQYIIVCSIVPDIFSLFLVSFCWDPISRISKLLRI